MILKRIYINSQRSIFQNNKTITMSNSASQAALPLPGRQPSGTEHQELFVQSLKQEIYDLRQKQRDYNQLADQLKFLEGKHRQGQDDRRNLDSENNLKLTQNQGHISELIKELDLLKLQNLDAENEQERLINTIQDSNANLQRQNEEYTELRAELGVMENRNFAERRDIERLEGDLRDSTGLSNKYFGEINRLKETINARDIDIRGYKLRVDQLDGELDQCQRRIATLTEAREQKDEDLASVHVKIGQENHQLAQTKAALQKLDSEIQYFESLNHKHMQSQNTLSKMNDQEFFRGKELTNLENDRKITLKLREDEVAALKGEIEQFKHLNGRQINDQYEFKNEVEALKRHVALLNQQNFELSTELEKFIETDETIRRTLNRKGKVEEIRYKVDEAIMRSMHEVQQRRSPERNARSANQYDAGAFSPERGQDNGGYAMTTPYRRY